MPGLAAYALAGAAGGLGEGIQQLAAQRREDAKAAIARTQQLEDRQASWSRDDAVYGRNRADALSDYGRSRNDALSDEQRGLDRQDAAVDRRASAYADAYQSGDEMASISFGGVKSNARYASQWFIERGYPPHVAAGLTGNMMQESGPGLDTKAVGDNGNAYGAGQWNGPRRHALFAFAKDNGLQVDDLDTQLEFLHHEMNTTESEARDAIMATSSAEDAARVASEKFWRPGVPHVRRRQEYSAEIYRVLADPDTPESVREDIRAGLAGATSPGASPAGNGAAKLTNQMWMPEVDGSQVLMGYNEQTGAMEAIPDARTGQPTTKPPEIDGATGMPNISDEGTLRKEFTSNPIVGDFAKQADAYGRILATSRQSSAAGDLAMIFNFMKLLDPGSVVRESEFATAQGAAGMDERVYGLWNRVRKGERLSDNQRADFLSVAERTYAEAEGRFGQVYDQYTSIAQAYNMPSERVLIDYRQAAEDDDARPPSGGGSGFQAAPQPDPNAALLTPADRASPLPDDLIGQGRAILDGISGAPASPSAPTQSAITPESLARLGAEDLRKMDTDSMSTNELRAWLARWDEVGGAGNG